MKTLTCLGFVGLMLFLSACTQTDDLGSTLESQFGTPGFDAVEDVAYTRSGTLYAIGIKNSALDPREHTPWHYYEGYKPRKAFLRRYSVNGALLWESPFELEAAYRTYPHSLMARAVAADANGNAVVAWSAVYFEPGSGASNEVATFNYLSKYRPDGIKLWRVSVGRAPVTDLALDTAGNVYAISGRSLEQPVASQGVLAKYSAGGVRAWQKTYPRNAQGEYIHPSGVTVSRANHVFVVRSDSAVEKYTSAGSKLLTRTGNDFGCYYDDEYAFGSCKIGVGVNEELFISGRHFVRSEETYEYCDASSYIDYYEGRIYKLSTAGNLLWQRSVAPMSVKGDYGGCLGMIGWQAADGLAITTDTLGNAYIVGGNDSGNAFMAKFSRAGARLWLTGFSGGARIDGATSVATYDGSAVYIGGVTYGGLVEPNRGGSDAVLRKMDKNGVRLWTR